MSLILGISTERQFVNRMSCEQDIISTSTLRYEFMYSCGRVSPIWDVTASTIAPPSEPRPRTVDLSGHKKPHPLFQPERSLPWDVPAPAKTHRPTGRTQDLSTPKLRAEGPFRDPQWPVSVHEPFLAKLPFNFKIEVQRVPLGSKNIAPEVSK